MGVITYQVPEGVQRMTIGVQGEANVREYLFDVTEWRQITGDLGTAEMVVQRRGDSSPYAAAITMHDENTVSWVPTAADTAKDGVGKLQLMWIASGQTVKTKIFDMKVDPALDYDLPDDSLDPWASWMPDVINAAAEIGSIETKVDTRLDSQDAAIAAIRAAVGSPLVANTAAAMTDHDKIYVYTGDESGFTAGNWYYYNGTAWVSGGVYNSAAVETDTTLSVPGVPADAKAAGDEIDSVKSALQELFTEAPNPDVWEVGGIDVGTGKNVSNPVTNRLRTVLSNPFNGLCALVATPGYQIILYCYDNSDAYLGTWNGTGFSIGSATWRTTIQVTNIDASATRFRIALKLDTGADMSLNDYAGCTFVSASRILAEHNATTMENVLSTINDEKITVMQFGLESLRTGAIDSTGGNTDSGSYYGSSYRTAGHITIPDAVTHVISEVKENEPTNYYQYISFYDDSFAFLSRVGGHYVATVTAERPANAKYCRVSLTQITTSEMGIDNIALYRLRLCKEKTISPVKKWYVLGDSISAGYYSMTERMAQEAGLTLSYISPVTTEGGEVTGSVWDKTLSHTYWKYANDWFLKQDLVGMAYPGQGYFRVASNGQNGIYVVKNNDFSDAGLITVAWGFNDWHYDQPRGNHDLIDSGVPYPVAGYDTSQITTVNQAIWYCLGELIRQAPNAKIVVQTPMNGWAYGGDFSTNWGIGYEMSSSGKLSDIHDDIVYWCNYYGLQYIEMTYNNSVVNRRNIKDTIIDGSHPSDAAHKQLGRTVAIALKYI